MPLQLQWPKAPIQAQYGRVWSQRHVRGCAGSWVWMLNSTVIGTLYALAEKNFIEREVVAQAIKYLGVDPDMVQRQTGYFTVICPEEFVCRYRPLKELLSPI